MKRIRIALHVLCFSCYFSRWSCRALSIRRNEQGQPRLTSVVSGTLNGLTFLGLGPCQDKKITIRSKSNRHVLQGKFQELSISMQAAASSYLFLDQFRIEGKDLHFGYTPLLIAVGIPSLIWFASIRFILVSLSLGILWRRNRKQRLALMTSSSCISTFYKAVGEQLNRLRQLLQKAVQGSPCQLTYTCTLTDSAMTKSPVIQQFAIYMLQNFMANSALPLAAAVGDTTNLLLSGTTAEATASSTTTSIVQQTTAMWKENEASSFQLSKLLAATSFDLNASPTFCSDGHVLLPCNAKLPDKSRLDFFIRTKLTPVSSFSFGSDNGGSSLAFSPAECQVDVDAAISKEHWSRALLPNILWLPIGTDRLILNLAFPKVHRLTKIKTTKGKSEISGRIVFFPLEETKKKNRGFEQMLKRLGLPFAKSKNGKD